MDIIRPESSQPIPSHAKKVFQGILFSVYQWEQKLFDGKVVTFEKVKRRDTVGIIAVTDNGKIIVADETQPGTLPFIGLPGGIIDDGEDPLTAGKRELLEETGFVATEWELFDAVQPGGKIDWAIYTFLAKGCRKVQEPHLDSGEQMRVKEVDWDEFMSLTKEKQFRAHELALKFYRETAKLNGLEELKKHILG